MNVAITFDEHAVMIAAPLGRTVFDFPTVSHANPDHIGFNGVPQPIDRSDIPQIIKYLDAAVGMAKARKAEVLAIKARPEQVQAFKEYGLAAGSEADDEKQDCLEAIFGRPEKRQGAEIFYLEFSK